jgi:hypothetical protein
MESSRARSSGVRTRPTALRLSFSWASVRAPITTEVTLGLPISQASATCAAEMPCPSAIATLDEVVELLLVMDGRLAPVGKLARALGKFMATAIFAGPKATSEGAPDKDAEPLVNRDWHKFVFGLACLQSVVDLLADRPDALFALRHTESFIRCQPEKLDRPT